MNNKSTALITFKKDFSATDNITENNSTVHGGVILATGTIKFEGKATFTNNKIFEKKSFAKGGVFYLSNGNILFENEAIFKDNLIESSFLDNNTNYRGIHGGAIYSQGNNSQITFEEKVIFENNKLVGENPKADGESQGGAITFYAGKGMVFKGDAIFNNNSVNSESAAGGAIMSTTNMYFYGVSLFSNNKIFTDSGGGGAIYHAGEAVFYNNSFFVGNLTSGKTIVRGGAIRNGTNSNITFNNSYFSNNFAQSESGEAEGGAIYNEGTLTFNGENIFENNKTNGKLNDIHNVGSILVKGSLITNGGITGNGSITIDKDGVLDIKTGTVEVGEMTLKEGALLKIGVNSLTEHGKVNGLVTGSETSKIALNLAMNTKNGIYQVFDRDNDLTLQENKLFNIKDLENGAYEVSKKTSENLMKDFDMSASESAVAVAFIESESAHKVFNQVQEEMLEALQSEDKAQVQKAKKALKAVGTSEQPSSQSIAASHFNELTRVISQMAMEKEAEIVGHSGGDTDPRAKVYIKGLYDRTKSSMGEGFRARSKGAVLGVQSEVTEDLTLGVGYATSQTTAKEDLRRTEVDTNTGFISAHYQPNTWWISGLATFSRGEYEEEKQILSSMGKASYDVDSWGAQVMTGYDIRLDNAIITPEVGMRYLSVKQEGYTDTLGTTVSGTQSDYLTALVGVKGVWDMDAICPTAGVTVGYDVISDDVSALNTLANGASYTVNGEALDRLSTGVSLGVEADLGERTTLKLEYSGTYRKEYQDHSGMLRLEWRF